MYRLPVLIITGGFLCLPAPLLGQESPPCSEPIQSAFDFWIGSWEVRLGDGSLVGHNTIREMAGGCGLAENWRGVSGSVGESLNWVDPGDGRWHQLWLDRSGQVLRLAGGPDGEGMTLQGTGRDPELLHRISWTPMDEDRVRQLWQVSSDGGESWSELFDGYYSRLPESETSAIGVARCDTPEGRRFDFWPGEWRVRSRTRASDGEWHSAVGVWRAEAVLGGCGFVDFTTGDYGQGTMSGMGTRFYDPQQDRWVLTWISTLNPGQIGVWEGRFGTDGTGEFYRETETADGPVRSRIRWLDVREDAAEWDHSVSRGGGSEWRIMWEMEFTRLTAAPGNDAG